MLRLQGYTVCPCTARLQILRSDFFEINKLSALNLLELRITTTEIDEA